MSSPCKTVCKRVETDAGDTLFLLVQWWSDGSFDLDVTNTDTAWRAERVTCPVFTTVSREEWTLKAREAFGFSPSQTEFHYDTFQLDDGWEFRWYWKLDMADVKGMGTAKMQEVNPRDIFHRFLDEACELSLRLTDMTLEHEKTQESMEKDLEILRQNITDRKVLYSRCAALINHKQQEIKEKDREIAKKERENQELRSMISGNMNVDDPYSEVTS